jgi:CheY-like chemotaxis protein
VESEPGLGSQFTVNLPWGRETLLQQEIPAGNKKWTRAEPPITPLTTDQSRGNILLAEDNMANILTIAEYLESHGYEIRAAHDGLEAIQMAESMNPDIILMDIHMPVMDGLEAMRRLRADPRFVSTPIIALTALAMPGDRERCIAAGANEYISKPVSLKKLRHIINEMLGRANE